MRILSDFAIPGQRAPALAILLPGALQQPEDLVRAGFIETVRQRAVPLDLALLDLGLEYIGDSTDGTVLQRIHDRVVQPARLNNYCEIWLVGISIGGFMAISYAERYPGQISGLCLLAPYPGNRILTGQIRAAGGLQRWHANSAAGDDAECRVWRWLHTQRTQTATAQSPQIHLGYGREDRFGSGLDLMADALAAHADTVAGGHDWQAWQQLWINFIDRTATRFGHGNRIPSHDAQ
ncbi:alpha/beta hydrolase [Herminiimonas sp. CN]|uniref:alpha/beta hydrolase n=1 Tax=Herminiimonas sp. CN TaxID=1349818 RepID=UPI0004740B74|nr:alpha/beta hydrolase [Herminiimonas sp. CN]